MSLKHFLGGSSPGPIPAAIPMKPVPICTTMLPKSVRDRMLEALKIDPDVPPGESPLRTRELESVIFHARCQFPKLFRDRL